MKSYLDISGCDEEWRSKIGVGRIPVKISVHETDLDVIEHQLTSDARKKLRNLMIEKYKNSGIKPRLDLPIGFYLKTIPPGAVLHLEA